MISPDEVETVNLEEIVQYKKLLRKIEHDIDNFLRRPWTRKEYTRWIAIDQQIRFEDIKKLVYAYRKLGWACRPNIDVDQLVFQNPSYQKCGWISKKYPFWILQPAGDCCL